MARKKRKTSEIGVYTVVLRTKNLCFKNDDAKHLFFAALKNSLKKDGAVLYAYAVGNKDAYLIVKEGENGLASFVKRLCLSFVYKYKKFVKTVNSVFYDRYLSEPIDNNEQLVDAVVRVNNLNKKTDANGNKLNFETSGVNYFENRLVNVNEMLKIVDKSKLEAMLNSELQEKQKFVVVEKLSDREVADYIFYTYGIKASEISKISKPLLNDILVNVGKITKASARQIGRITKISLRYLWNLFKKKEEVKEVKWKTWVKGFGLT